jgi:phosphopantetheinyl transferase
MIRVVGGWTLAPRCSAPFHRLPTSLYLESLRTTTASTFKTNECTILWDEQLPVGARCVGLQLLGETTRDWQPCRLHPLEMEYGKQLPSIKTRQSFWLGRLALRQVIDTPDPILKDSYGRPRLPEGYVASISHKGTAGVALVQPPTRETSSCIGVDLEWSQPQGNRNVARKVLTLREQKNLGQIPVSAARTKRRLR